MPKLHVVTEEVIACLEQEQLPLTTLLSPNSIVVALSAQDVALSRLAFHHFPFSFDKESTLVPCFSLLDGMEEGSAKEQQFRERVLQQYTSLHLTETSRRSPTDHRVDRYRVIPLNDVDWVISVQRHICEVDNPEQEALRVNHAFFDDLMMHTCHQVPFHMLSQTNVFAKYLATIKYAR